MIDSWRISEVSFAWFVCNYRDRRIRNWTTWLGQWISWRSSSRRTCRQRLGQSFVTIAFLIVTHQTVSNQNGACSMLWCFVSMRQCMIKSMTAWPSQAWVQVSNVLVYRHIVAHSISMHVPCICVISPARLSTPTILSLVHTGCRDILNILTCCKSCFLDTLTVKETGLNVSKDRLENYVWNTLDAGHCKTVPSCVLKWTSCARRQINADWDIKMHKHWTKNIRRSSWMQQTKESFCNRQ